MLVHITAFLNYLTRQKRYSEHTVISYRNDLTSVDDYFSDVYERTALQDVSYIHIRSYIVHLLKDGLTPKSVNRKISSLRSFLQISYTKRNS